MNKKISFVASLILMMALVFSSAVLAFQDLPEGSEGAKILNLRDAGIIQGINHSKFAPNDKLTVAQAVQMIVKGFDLSIDSTLDNNLTASDLFDHISDHAWYADAFIIAQLNGIDLPRNVQPEEDITREAFVHYLFQAMVSKADLAFIEIYILFEDEDEVTETYMNSVQKMLIANIASLDEERRFYPKQTITRAEAAVMLHDAIDYVKKYAMDQPLNDGVNMNIEEIDDEILKVTLDWGEQANPGYRISIDRIEFDNLNKTAIINYSLHYPDPDKFYPQVITNPTAITYISSGYEVSIQHSPFGNASSSVTKGAGSGMSGMEIPPVAPDEPVMSPVPEAIESLH